MTYAAARGQVGLLKYMIEAPSREIHEAWRKEIFVLQKRLRDFVQDTWQRHLASSELHVRGRGGPGPRLEGVLTAFMDWVSDMANRITRNPTRSLPLSVNPTTTS